MLPENYHSNEIVSHDFQRGVTRATPPVDGFGLTRPKSFEELSFQDHYLSQEKNILSILLESWRVISAIGVVGFLIGTIYLFLATPLFTSAAIVRIGSYAPIVVGPEIENILRQQSMEQSYKKTQVATLGSLTVADRVFSDDSLGSRIREYLRSHSTAFFSWGKKDFFSDLKTEGYETTVDYLNQYLKLVKINPLRDTTLVSIEVETDDSDFSRILANAHAQAFIDEVRYERQSAIEENTKFLSTQANELQIQVGDAERRVSEYARDNKLFALANEEQLLTRRIRTLTEQHAQAMGERIKLGNLVKQLKGSQSQSSTIVDDDSIRNLRTALEQAQADYANLRIRFTPDYPEVAQAFARVTSLRKTIASQRAQSIAAVEGRYRSARQTELSLAKQIEKQKGLDHETSKKLVEYNSLQREYDSLKDLHQSILKQLKEMQIAASGDGNHVSITDHAVSSVKPTSPKKGTVLILLSLLGGALGAIYSISRQLLDRTVSTIEDLGFWVGLTSLGSVPDFASIRKERVFSTVLKVGIGNWLTRLLGTGECTSSLAEPERDSLINFTMTGCGVGSSEGGSIRGNSGRLDSAMRIGQPTSSVAEAFRTIRTSLLLSSADHPPKAVLVTSPKKGEGKTTIASNLGVMLAQGGYRTVLIDTDIRSPQLSFRFGINEKSRGLVEYLAGQAELEEVLLDTEVEGLSVIPTGCSAPNPAELVGSRRMTALIELLSSMYDHVILDGPPLIPVADSLMMSRLVDGVIVVVRSHHSDRELCREAINRLTGVRARILGLVMNGVMPEKTGINSYSGYAGGYVASGYVLDGH